MSLPRPKVVSSLPPRSVFHPTAADCVIPSTSTAATSTAATSTAATSKTQTIPSRSLKITPTEHEGENIKTMSGGGLLSYLDRKNDEEESRGGGGSGTGSVGGKSLGSMGGRSMGSMGGRSMGSMGGRSMGSLGGQSMGTIRSVNSVGPGILLPFIDERNMNVRLSSRGPFGSIRRAATSLALAALLCAAAISIAGEGRRRYAAAHPVKVRGQGWTGGESPTATSTSTATSTTNLAVDGQGYYPPRNPNFHILLTSKEASYPLFVNWVEHYRRLELPYLVILFCEDQATLARCERDFDPIEQDKKEARRKKEDPYGPPHSSVAVGCLARQTVFPLLPPPPSDANKNDDEDEDPVGDRPDVLLWMLLKMKDTFIADVGSPWLRDPFPLVDFFHRDPSRPEALIWTMRQDDGDDEAGRFLCGGDGLYKYAPETIHAVARWARYARDDAVVPAKSETEEKECAFNRALGTGYGDVHGRSRRFPSRTFPPALFPAGDLYAGMTSEERGDAVILRVDSGWGGYEWRRDQLIKNGAWIVDGVTLDDFGAAVEDEV